LIDPTATGKVKISRLFSKPMPSQIPIVVFAYNRLAPLQKTLRALEKADDFPGGPIFVYSDGWRSNDAKDQEAVAQLRSWLKTWAGKRPFVSIISQSTNRGLRRSITEGVTEQLKNFESLIVLEDDIIVSRCFIRFMHESLNRFNSNEKVCQVSGYFVPHRQKLAETGFLSVPACWGWATWARAWKYYNDDVHELLKHISPDRFDEFNIENSYPYLEALTANAKGVQNTWAVRWYASVFPRNLLTLYPSKSLTRNIGFQYSGTNCHRGKTERIFTYQPISATPPSLPAAAEITRENTDFRNTLANFYRWQSEQWSAPSIKEIWLARWQRLLQRFMLRP
jgi:hypothetical protein